MQELLMMTRTLSVDSGTKIGQFIEARYVQWAPGQRRVDYYKCKYGSLQRPQTTKTHVDTEMWGTMIDWDSVTKRLIQLRDQLQQEKI